MSDTQVPQVLLHLNYLQLARQHGILPRFSDVEFRCYSQNGEDGILLFLFSLLGTTNRKVIEICAGDGCECNAANLIVNHGWRGLLFDGNPDNVTRARHFYGTCRDTCIAPPQIVHAWITAESVCRLVAEHGYAGPVDLLSLDVDGNDYWIWNALDNVVPRVVFLEFNAQLGPSDSLSIRYDPEFRLDLTVLPYRCGASLAAFVKLGRERGYRLVGLQSLGFNAFFVRDGLGERLLPERSPEECFAENARLCEWHREDLEAMLSGAQPWVRV